MRISVVFSVLVALAGVAVAFFWLTTATPREVCEHTAALVAQLPEGREVAMDGALAETCARTIERKRSALGFWEYRAQANCIVGAHEPAALETCAPSLVK